MPLSPMRVGNTTGVPPGSPRQSPRSKTPERSPKKSLKKSPTKVPEGSFNDLLKSPRRNVESGQSPSRSPARIALRTEEEQQAAAREKERQEIQANREARRKSLGLLSPLGARGSC